MTSAELGFGLLVLAGIAFPVALPTALIRWARERRNQPRATVSAEFIAAHLGVASPPPAPTPAAPPVPVHETLAAVADAMAQIDRQERISKRELILRAIRQSPEGLTTDEIQTILDLSHQTASARVHELERDGYIAPSGNRRLTRQGKTAHVWIVAPAKSSEAA